MKYFVFMIFGLFTLLITQAGIVLAEDPAMEAKSLFKDASTHFTKGEYKEAISLYDKILKIYPNHTVVLKMKAISEGNIGLYQKSTSDFFKVYQKDRNDVIALLGLGSGFGNLGEYKEAKSYFDQAYALYPNNNVVKNYKQYADRIVKKYPYKPTEKPKNYNGSWTQKSFDSYVSMVSSKTLKDKRYIENPNPSFDVIKKFLRDYQKWNFEQQVKTGADSFPDPQYTIKNGTYIVNYKIFVNKQPSGLPLDHVSTLNNSMKYWESQSLNSPKGKYVVRFSQTSTKSDANVWVTWTVRNLGDGVLGHSNIGKGVLEVALGDYNCDGTFQLYDVPSVEKIMRHELGHSIGLGHTNDISNIMYPELRPGYAYCLIN